MAICNNDDSDFKGEECQCADCNREEGICLSEGGNNTVCTLCDGPVVGCEVGCAANRKANI